MIGAAKKTEALERAVKGRSLGMDAWVRLKRGAGAGCVTPSTSTKVLRSTLWGCCGASLKDSTGA